MDIRLDPSSHDCLFINGQCPVTTSDFDVVAQRLKIRLKTFQGEYNFNTSYGIPYFQRILGKKARKQEVDNIFQQAILEEEGVKEIIEFSSTFINNVYELKFKVKNDKNLISPLITINSIS